MGMTYHLYWESDCTLAKAYRRAYELRQDEQNRYAWLQGMYVYEAVCDAAPLFREFAKGGTRARPYAEKPYDFNKKRHMTKEEKIADTKRKTVDYLNEMTARFNESFRARKAKQMENELAKAMNKPAKTDNIEAQVQTNPEPTDNTQQPN